MSSSCSSVWLSRVSTQRTSTPASHSARARATPSWPLAGTDAPTSSCPRASRDIIGNVRTFFTSLAVIIETSLPSSSTMGSLPTLALRICRTASSRLTGSCAVTTLVSMTYCSSLDLSCWLSASREVAMPSNLPPSLPSSVMGTPLMPRSACTFSKSATVFLGPRVAGSRMKPLTQRLARRTLSTCAAIGWYGCTKPMPPARASAMAMSVPVTVSEGAPTRGVLSEMLRVRRVLMSTSEGSKETCPGSSTKSS
mmetsp:Transcript_42616/g.110121  ORF Transcript_42616/g.110121 Transcript_42616/m.110121 type:complete len:253 (+) Transcript_42616:770-1528(+)